MLPYVPLPVFFDRRRASLLHILLNFTQTRRCCTSTKANAANVESSFGTTRVHPPLLRLLHCSSIKRLQFVLLVHIYFDSSWNLRCYLCEAPGTPGVTCVRRASAEMLTGSLPELRKFSMSSYDSAQTPSIPKADKPNGGP